jgi:predicted RNA polymerase sigma factor
VLKALQSLPGELRAPLVLHARRNYSYREIARRFDISVAAVALRIQRARDQIQVSVSYVRRSVPGQSHRRKEATRTIEDSAVPVRQRARWRAGRAADAP